MLECSGDSQERSNQMQTPIVQSVATVTPSEGGNSPADKLTNQSTFGALFSMLEQESTLEDSASESEISESSDTETPDEIPLVTDIKNQHPQATKITALLTRGEPTSTKIPKADEPTLFPASSADSTQRAEQGLGGSMRESSLVFDRQTTPSQNLVLTAGSERKVVEVYSKVGDKQAPNLHQEDPNQSIGGRTFYPAPPAAVHPSSQNGSQILATDFDHIKLTAAKLTEDNRNQRFILRNRGEASRTDLNSSQTPKLDQQQHLPPVSLNTPPRAVETSDGVDSLKMLPESTETELTQLNLHTAQNSVSGTALQTASAGTVRNIGYQLVDAVVQQAGRPVEVALNPEELGRVRIALTTLESGISVAIVAERPETLELMRRHIEQLEAEFRQLGYENIGFEFSGGDAQTSDYPESDEHTRSVQLTEISDPNLPSPVPMQTNGVDIRL
jgi:Flagellar hook-length control protein FliK